MDSIRTPMIPLYSLICHNKFVSKTIAIGTITLHKKVDFYWLGVPPIGEEWNTDPAQGYDNHQQVSTNQMSSLLNLAEHASVFQTKYLQSMFARSQQAVSATSDEKFYFQYHIFYR
jgi:hypothetical protein